MSYKTLANPAVYEYEIKRSKFICYAFPISSSEDANEKYREIRKKHSDATHNCYAYVCGVDENTVKFSDDGEPSGTAGQPILEVLKKKELKNSLLIVTRYFGGIKLGGGGLIGAYTESAAGGVAAAGVAVAESCRLLELKFDYSRITVIDGFLSSRRVRVSDKIYDSDVVYYVAIPTSDVEGTVAEIIDICMGKIDVEHKGEKYVFF